MRLTSPFGSSMLIANTAIVHFGSFLTLLLIWFFTEPISDERCNHEVKVSIKVLTTAHFLCSIAQLNVNLQVRHFMDESWYDMPIVYKTVSLFSMFIYTIAVYSACTSFIDCRDYLAESLYLRWLPLELLSYLCNFLGLIFAVLCRQIASYMYRDGPRF